MWFTTLVYILLNAYFKLLNFQTFFPLSKWFTTLVCFSVSEFQCSVISLMKGPPLNLKPMKSK